MLHRLHVRGFKSLRDVQVELGRLVVVFGPNAAGKSNLLEAAVLLSRLVQERTIAEALDRGIRGSPSEVFSLGPDGVGGFLERDEAKLSLAARVGSDSHPECDYYVEIGIRPRTGELFLANERLQSLTKGGKPIGKAVIELSEDGTKLRVRRRGRQAHPFEESPGQHFTLISNLQFSGEHYPAFDLLRSEVGAWKAVYLDPRESMRRAETPREVVDIGDRGQWLVPFLHRLREDSKYEAYFRSIVRSVRHVIPSIDDVTTELSRTRGEIDLKIKQSGIWLSARVVSEGTLRVLALCAMAANPFSNGMVAFEEPENGVHPRRVEDIARILVHAARTRQVIVTTHSPLVVGELFRLARAGSLPRSELRLIACSGDSSGTRLTEFDLESPLFESDEVKRALEAADDTAKIETMLRLGWIDG